ncbi:hypothetical protein GQ44DRAFT_604058 [Phaeosphaeriaceae sp. PMI808]|nr:hypothetical protein GQ44DRAFT_604058 [Phaeosphaeriaceae sp. PMI808]
MSTKSVDPDSRDNSPDHEGSPGGKRTSKKRKVLSCYACRNRKMKCDRIYPICGRCQKTGRADQCTYDPRLLEDATGNNGFHAGEHNAAFALPENGRSEHAPGSTSLDALLLKTRAQERRIELLERKLATKENKALSQFIDFSPVEPQIKEDMMFRGKGFKTQFCGSTSVMSTIAQFRELQAFTREALTVDHSIMRVKNDFKTFRVHRKIDIKQMTNQACGTNEDIFAVLPERSAVDLQVGLYFQTWGNSYKIMHEPSFWKEYLTFWEQKPEDLGSPGFAVILILIIAVTKCLKPKDDVFEGDTTSDRQAASNLIEICDMWINRQSRKRLTLQFFQLQCLSLLAKRVNCVKLKQDWVVAGDLVRLALASGMHRDPSLLSTGRISPFEKEMKKRLWVTIIELELQSSIENGLQSSLTSLYWDTPVPTNLPDDAFSVDTQELPASRPLEHFTSATYLAVSRQSIPFRIHLMQLLNDPSETLPYSEILHYDAQINELLSEMPKWDDPRAVIPYALLQLQLRQFLLILHAPYAILAPKNDRFNFSFSACINAASSIITIHEDLLSKGFLALNNIRNDAVRVGLTLSQVVYHNCALYSPVKPPASPLPIRETHFAENPTVGAGTPSIKLSLPVLPREPFLTRVLCTSAIDLLDIAVQTCERKVMRMGTGYMEFWLLSAAIGILPSPSSSKPPTTSIAHIMSVDDDIEARCKKTLHRFQALTFRVLALQKDPENSLASALRTTMYSVSPSDLRTPRSTGPPSAIGAGYETTSLATNVADCPVMPGMGIGFGEESGSKEMSGPFDMLQDMQIDVGGWNYPDFLAFDLGGDF